MRRMYDENEIKSIASESGGGKLYKHTIDFQFADSANEYRIIFVVYSATSEEANTISKFRNLYNAQTPICIINAKGGDHNAAGVGYLTNLLDDSSSPELYGYLGSWTPVHTGFPNAFISDTVTEL